MVKYQYLDTFFPYPENSTDRQKADAFQTWANELGDQGWQMITREPSVFTEGNACQAGYRCCFVQERNDAPAEEMREVPLHHSRKATVGEDKPASLSKVLSGSKTDK